MTRTPRGLDWAAMFERIETAASKPAAAQPASVPRRRTAPSTFEYRKFPLHLYFQSAASFVLGARNVQTTFAPGFRALAQTSTGMSLRLEMPLVANNSHADNMPRIAAEHGLRPRTSRSCDGFVWLNLHACHPRYAALRRASLTANPAMQQSSYAAFAPKLNQLCDGTLTENEATELVDTLVARALRLSACEHVMLDPRIYDVMLLCDERGRWRIDDMAHSVGLSASRLSHLFTEETGLSFRQYALWMRTARAWEHVALSPERSLTDIAHDLEFADLAHMSHSFNVVYGYPPSALREPGRWNIRGKLTRPGARIPPRYLAVA